MEYVNDTISRLGVGTINKTESTLIELENGSIIKTMIFTNNNTFLVTLELNVDGAIIIEEIPANKTIYISETIVCNLLKANITYEDTEDETSLIFYHISGIQLGNS